MKSATLWIIFIAASGRSDELPLCTDPVIKAQPCANNDTYCGDWDVAARKYTPANCRYREISNEQARQCIGERTIACVGDSVIRDMCIGLAMYLSNEQVEDGAGYKYDRKAEIHSHYTNATKIGSFKSWKLNRSNYNGLLFPKTERSDSEWKWQVQVWELHNTEHMQDHRLEDILMNKMPHEEPSLSLHKIDFAFWGHGLHDLADWNTPPYGQRFFDTIVSQYVRVRETVPTPVVWTAINPHCLALDPLAQKFARVHRPSPFIHQAHLVREANYVTRQTLRQMNISFYDSAAPLRTPQLCDISSDGVHVKMWVDLVRAQMLLNHLCDEDSNWVGDISRF